MRQTELIPQNEVKFKRTNRPAKLSYIGSGDAGKILPIAVEPVLREESARGRVNIAVEMGETPETVINAVHACAYTYFVPYLAFGQFNGSLEELNRSYMKENSISTGSVIPFFETNKYWNYNTSAVVQGSSAINYDTTVSTSHYMEEFYRTLGIHTDTATMNMSYVQAYNHAINHRRKAKSPKLALRNEFEHKLAEAFWPASIHSHIVGDYDEKLIAGEVTLNGLTFTAPITSTKAEYNTSDMGTPTNAVDSTASGYIYNPAADGAQVDNVSGKFIWNDIMAELTATSSSQAKMNLADIDRARKTAAFAKLRSMYSGQTDDFIIDLLMQGLTVPLEYLKDPILCGMSKSVFAQGKRYATDAGNLDDSVTRGMVTLSHNVSMPRTSTGGILITTVEFAPEQIWERSKDYYLYLSDPDKLPNALRDHLSIEGGQGVAAVTKDHLDVDHNTPTAVLGYTYLNHEYRKNDVKVGGKFIRPASDAYAQDRARIWTNEVANPSLSTDMYLCTNLHKKVFADQTVDSFEVSCTQDLSINTNVQFGERLLETDATSDYEAITALGDNT